MNSKSHVALRLLRSRLIRHVRTMTLLASVPILTPPTHSQEEGTANAKPTPPPIVLRVLETRKISLGDHSLILNRVAPPVLPAPPPPTAAEVPTTAARAEENRLAHKKHEVLFLSATV